MEPAQDAGSNEPQIFLPLTVNGPPADAVLKEDKSEVELFDASGLPLHSGNGDDIEIRHGISGPDQFTQSVKLPARFMQEHKDTPIQVHATYSMTLFTLHNSYTMKAINDDQMLEGGGVAGLR